MPVIEQWPEMTDAQRAELRADLDEAARRLTAAANKVTRYPGGGIPAHRAREAAKLAREARRWIDGALRDDGLNATEVCPGCGNRRKRTEALCLNCRMGLADAPPWPPCKTCSRLYRGNRVRCPVCGLWRTP